MVHFVELFRNLLYDNRCPTRWIWLVAASLAAVASLSSVAACSAANERSWRRHCERHRGPRRQRQQELPALPRAQSDHQVGDHAPAHGRCTRTSGRCSDVTFDVPQGATFGLIGSNGSGKSTLLKCLARILHPTSGTIAPRPDRGAARARAGLPSRALRPREHLPQRLDPRACRKNEIDAQFDEIVDFSGVEQFIDQPVKNYSSGMYVRLGFSIAINVDPDILVVDEVLAVGDEEFQDKCFQKFRDFKARARPSSSSATRWTTSRTCAITPHGSITAS